MALPTIDTNRDGLSYAQMTDQIVEHAISEAQFTFEIWRTASYLKRSNLLHKIATLMRIKKSSLARIITADMGKLIREAEGEVELSAAIFDYYAEHGEEFLTDKLLYSGDGEALIRSCPIGVVLGVMPWTFPFFHVARFVAPNIMAGNTVLIKHASNVTSTATALQELFDEAEAPQGLYTSLYITSRHASSLLSDSRIKGVFLNTGEEAASNIAKEAGKHLKKVVLETSGTDTFIILEDADIDNAVEWAVIGRMNTTGQSVTAKRFIVVDAIADEFVEKFKAKLVRLKIGDPMNPETQVGPLISEAAFTHLLDQVNRSVAAGATLLLGGARADGPGTFMKPTILTDLRSGMPAYHEELTGPVTCFHRVNDERAAIELANNLTFGLGYSIYTRDSDRGRRLADSLDTCMIFVNHPTWIQHDRPFDTTMHSGFGRELSEPRIHEFTNKKLIRISPPRDPN